MNNPMHGINMSTFLQIMKLCDSVLSQKEQTSKVSNAVFFCIYCLTSKLNY